MADTYIENRYNQLQGSQGFKKKVLPGLHAFFTVLFSPITALFMGGIAAILTIPFIIALWAKPTWLAQKMKRPETDFDTTEKRAVFTFIALLSAVILPCVTLYQTITHEVPKKFKQQSIDGLTRAEKRGLFVNVMALAALLLVIFPPAGFAIVIAGCAKAATATHLSSVGANGGSMFIMFAQLGSLLIGLIAGKVSDCIDKKNCCQPRLSAEGAAPSSPASPSPSNKRSSPAQLNATFNPAGAVDPTPATATVVAATPPPRRFSLGAVPNPTAKNEQDGRIPPALTRRLSGTVTQ